MNSWSNIFGALYDLAVCLKCDLLHKKCIFHQILKRFLLKFIGIFLCKGKRLETDRKNDQEDQNW